VAAPFVPGLELAGAFYTEVVRPLLDEAHPGLPHAAALLGPGSEVLGYDSQRSADHDWGPRLQVLLAADDGLAAEITAMLARRLPESFRGYRTAFHSTHEPGGPPRHHVTVAGLRKWLTGRLGFDPLLPVTTPDWLATPTQSLAEITSGAVFHDGPGDLSRARTRLAWYPGDIWRYVLACQWQRVAEEEAFPGRCAEAGDGLGSAVVTARLARDLMRLCLLMCRRYPPYSKWLGTAAARLPEAAPVIAALAAAVTAPAWPAREHALCQALEAAAVLHNDLGITPPLDPRPRPYFDRPFLVLDAGRLTAALRESITDPRVRHLPGYGAADQFVDSTDALGDTTLLRAAIAAGKL
jgi:hypothetical protein